MTGSKTGPVLENWYDSSAFSRLGCQDYGRSKQSSFPKLLAYVTLSRQKRRVLYSAALIFLPEGPYSD